ncbi:MAG TPA: tetratricopeptide repeat protein [Candidatus Saccharimonadales bacterium]|nr:tetratricopeptide repeat protein [Candidatus Saccharimonadales bacterium]
MLTLFFIALIGLFAIYATKKSVRMMEPMPAKVGNRLQRLWDDFHIGVREKKYLRAEKALLTILRVDKKNATAYNRLGILYAKQKAFADAIECFEIAQSIEPSPSSLHNLGLIYYETGQYPKAANAFERALALEDDLAARHIAYAKVQENLGNKKQIVESLETAFHLEPNVQTFNLLVEAYDEYGHAEKAAELRERIEKLKRKQQTPAHVQQPRKVVM